MTSPRPTAQALAGNLRRLMAHHGLSQAQLGKKAGVGQSTLSNLLDDKAPLEVNPRATTIEQLASFFQVPSWQLLIPELSLDLLLSDHLGQLIANYRDATSEGRETISRIAESEARYATAGISKKAS